MRVASCREKAAGSQGADAHATRFSMLGLGYKNLIHSLQSLRGYLVAGIFIRRYVLGIPPHCPPP